MKRKSKKLKNSTPSPKAAGPTVVREIKKESQEECEEKTAVSTINYLIDAQSIKQEKELNASVKEEPIENNVSILFVEKTDAKFIFIELKLISIDIKCGDYDKLEQRFLCVDSKASIEHVKKFIAKKMNILEDFFEVFF